MKISKKLKLVVFLLFSLVCGFLWINSSVSTVFTSDLRNKVLSEQYKTDNQRIANFQKIWNKNPKKHYFLWASMFNVGTVALDSAGAAHAYAERAYRSDAKWFSDSVHKREFLNKAEFQNKFANKWTTFYFLRGIPKKKFLKNYKIFLEDNNLIEFGVSWHSKRSWVVFCYRITDFISEIKKIAKNKSQDLSNLDIDFTKFQGKARDQLLAMLDWNGNLRSGIWKSIDTQIKKGLGQDYFDALKPLFSKMQVLGIKNVSHKSFKTDYNFNFLANYNLNNLVFTDFLSKMKLAYGNFGDLYHLTKSVNLVINKIWTPWLQTLQNAKVFDLTHLMVDKKRVDVSSLVNSKVQEASELSLQQIQILKNLQPLGLEKFQVQVQTEIYTQIKIISSLAVSDSNSFRVYLSDFWTPKERQQTLTLLSEAPWLSAAAVGLKKLEFVSDGKNVVFHFDKLAAAFQIEIWKQKVIPNSTGFDFTKIKGEAQKQLLQVYMPGTKIYWIDFFENFLWSKKIKFASFFLDSLRLSLKKMQTLGLSQVNVSYKSNFSLLNLFDEINEQYKDLIIARESLQNLALLTFSPIPNHAKNVLDNAINVVAAPWLHTLQKADSLGFTHITVNKEEVDVSSLVNSKVKEASNLSLDQIKIIKNLQPLGFEKLKVQVQAWIGSKLDDYKTNIQPTLANFTKTEIQQIKINDTLYQVNLLLKESNFKLTGAKLPQAAKTQLLALAKAKITSQVLENTLQDTKLEIYRLTIVDNLNALQDKNVSQVVINNKTYSLTELNKQVNQNQTVTLLSAPAKTELTTLAKNAITKTQLDTALVTILEVREAVTFKKVKAAAKVFQTQKKSKQKKLIIGFFVGSGVLATSFLGGFLYWFFKIKK